MNKKVAIVVSLLALAMVLGLWSQRDVLYRHAFGQMVKADQEAVCVAAFAKPDLAASTAALAETMKKDQSLTHVEISRADGSLQRAMYHEVPGDAPKPLIVSLHPWRGDYRTPDPMAALAARYGVHYIHPDLRGPIGSAGGCCTDAMAADIDDAIAYAMANATIDRNRVFIYGVSGGGFAALCAIPKLTHIIAGVSVWAPITDLEAWYYQSAARRHSNPSRYDRDILACTVSKGVLNRDKARAQSPLYRVFPAASDMRIDLYAGIDDGANGSVPITHSIRYYNRLVEARGKGEITDAEIAGLLEQGAGSPVNGRLGDRAVFLKRSDGNASVTVFDGGHEAMPELALKAMLKNDFAVDDARQSP